jgi:hypothetical protein
MDAMTRAQAITDPTTATPVDIDTALAGLDHTLPGLHQGVRIALERVHQAAGDTKQRRLVHKNEQWVMAHEQAEATCRERRNSGDVTATQALVGLATAFLAVNLNRAEFDRLDAEFTRRGGWTRFVQCVHIHSGYHCVGGTLDRAEYRSERFWRPEFSGMDEATAIATLQQAAETLCSHCFPSAPVMDKPVDPDMCTGSGKGVRFAGNERGLQRAYGKCAVCPDCKQVQTVTAGLNYKTHFTVAAETRRLAEKAAALGKLVVGTGRNAEIKTVRATELLASDPFEDAEKREPAIVALAAHRDQPIETVRVWAEGKRRQRNKF